MGNAESLLGAGLFAQREALDRGEVSASDLLEACLVRIGRRAALNAVVSLRAEAARAEAEAARDRIAAGRPRSALDGIPVLLKDNIVQAGEPAGCASRILESFVSPYDAGVVERLQGAGAVLVGRANMDEFAMGSSTESSIHGPSRNPWDPERACGGSSGGSAAAVAADLVPLAFGSDTGGSIRQPASFCGVVGLKPTYGRVSRWGLVAFASSLDQIGPLGRRVVDCALALETVAGHDVRDSTSLPEPAPKLVEGLDGRVEGLRIGLPREYFAAEGVDPFVLDRVREAIGILEEAGARVVDVELPHTAYTIATYYLIATAEASSNLARFDGVRYGRRAEKVEDPADLDERPRSEGCGDGGSRHAAGRRFHDEPAKGLDAEVAEPPVDQGGVARGIGEIVHEADSAHAGRSSLLDRLERRNLIERNTDGADRRVILVTATTDGDRLANQLEAIVLALEAELAAALGPRDRTALARFFAAVDRATGVTVVDHTRRTPRS